MSKMRGVIVVAMTAASPGLALPAFADDFPPITAEERALKEVPGAPEAVAVFLYKKAEFRMMSPARNEPSSRLTVSARIKVLKDEGRQWGEVSLRTGARRRSTSRSTGAGGCRAAAISC